jgi:predicted nucleic acid-binding protein
MSEKVPLKGSICDVSFGYNAKIEGYMTLMLDIPKLGAMPKKNKK